jgi:hypothetical protein
VAKVRWSRVLRWAAAVLVVFFLILQAIPYGRAHDTPGTVREPPWDSPRTRELAVRACFDCHSNQTAWPWYSHVAPVSWYVQRHVEEGRGELNFSEFGIGRQETSDTAEVVRDGTMPPGYYLPLHSAARLSDEERAALIRGFQATFGLRRGGTVLPGPLAPP